MENTQRRLMSHGMFLFLLGLLTGFAESSFSNVRMGLAAHLEGGSRSALETTAADLQSELSETLAAAATIVRGAMRDITANAFAESGVELGYTVTTHHPGTVIRVELRRGRETVLVEVRDGGNVEFTHSGVTDNTGREQQLRLEQAAERRGVCLTQRV